jgi:hypothetical protein
MRNVLTFHASSPAHASSYQDKQHSATDNLTNIVLGAPDGEAVSKKAANLKTRISC